MTETKTSWPEFIGYLRHQWQPQGTAPVRLVRAGPSGFMECSPEELTAAIDQLEKLPLLDDKASPLERLAIRLLTEGW